MLENINFNLTGENRTDYRKNLILKFIEEKPGTGSGNLASRYLYNVECFNNYAIYLKRPTRLNKGFDFTVNISNIYFPGKRKHSNPSHSDIINILKYVKEKNKEEYSIIIDIINDIYNCKQCRMPDLKSKFTIDNVKYHPIQIILLALKWLFIEQDCAYWNYSGRRMLYKALLDECLLSIE